jgi:hypothetical protein
MKSRGISEKRLDCPHTGVSCRMVPRTRGINDWRGHQTRMGTVRAYTGRAGQASWRCHEHGIEMGGWQADPTSYCAEGCPNSLCRGASRGETREE